MSHRKRRLADGPADQTIPLSAEIEEQVEQLATIGIVKQEDDGSVFMYFSDDWLRKLHPLIITYEAKRVRRNLRRSRFTWPDMYCRPTRLHKTSAVTYHPCFPVISQEESGGYRRLLYDTNEGRMLAYYGGLPDDVIKLIKSYLFITLDFDRKRINLSFQVGDLRLLYSHQTAPALELGQKLHREISPFWPLFSAKFELQIKCAQLAAFRHSFREANVFIPTWSLCLGVSNPILTPISHHVRWLGRLKRANPSYLIYNVVWRTSIGLGPYLQINLPKCYKVTGFVITHSPEFGPKKCHIALYRPRQSGSRGKFEFYAESLDDDSEEEEDDYDDYDDYDENEVEDDYKSDGVLDAKHGQLFDSKSHSAEQHCRSGDSKVRKKSKRSRERKAIGEKQDSHTVLVTPPPLFVRNLTEWSFQDGDNSSTSGNEGFLNHGHGKHRALKSRHSQRDPYLHIHKPTNKYCTLFNCRTKKDSKLDKIQDTHIFNQPFLTRSVRIGLTKWHLSTGMEVGILGDEVPPSTAPAELTPDGTGNFRHNNYYSDPSLSSPSSVIFSDGSDMLSSNPASPCGTTFTFNERAHSPSVLTNPSGPNPHSNSSTSASVPPSGRVPHSHIHLIQSSRRNSAERRSSIGSISMGRSSPVPTSPPVSVGRRSFGKGARRDENWVELDLGTTDIIVAMATSGCPKRKAYASTYIVCHSLDGINYSAYYDSQDESSVLSGNTNATHVRFHYFEPPIQARFFRLVLKTWTNSSKPMCRPEFYSVNGIFRMRQCTSDKIDHCLMEDRFMDDDDSSSEECEIDLPRRLRTRISRGTRRR